ncbi:MAG TPA: hypothetical protein VHP11_02525, partial [Tepidisphaeraceae bacterium]|nr:hypothetical protein [Tepidisphaeraceae bacterium]
VVAGVGARRVQVAFLLAMLAALAEFWLGLTHLQSRFFVLAIPLAAMLLGTLRRRRMIAAGMGVMVLAAVPSLVMLDRTLSPTMDIMRRSGAVGIGDLTVFLPEKVAQLIASGGRIALVGDAQAFAYAMPMGDLRYRTIFDFDEQPGRSFLDAWLGENARQVKFQYSLVIDRAELVRFWETYARIPLPESLKGGGEPVVVPAEVGEE